MWQGTLRNEAAMAAGLTTSVSLLLLLLLLGAAGLLKGLGGGRTEQRGVVGAVMAVVSRLGRIRPGWSTGDLTLIGS